MKIRRRYPRVGPKIDVTPMADMVFLLLIFFMLSSPVFMQPGIKIKLPKTVTAEPELGDKLILNISKEEKLILNGKEVKLENLEEELRYQLLERTDKVLIIRADKEVQHGLVVEALDKAKLAGAEKLAIATEIKREVQKVPKGK